MSEELQVEDIQLGDGKEVVKGALITTQYRGTLSNGSEFDSSYTRGKPFQCVIGTGRVTRAGMSG
jgi:peptidylprolyl isomerase